MDSADLNNAITYMKERIDMLVEALLGDPADTSKPGFLIRLDRLERSYASHRRALALFGGTLITVIATVIAAFVIKLV